MVTEHHPHLPKHLRLSRRSRYGIISLSIAILGLITACVNHVQPPAATAILNQQPGLYPVVHVNDGDTVVVKTPTGNETVRFIGVDTPEVKDPRKPVQCFGQAASAHTKQVMNGISVRLEPDPEDTDRDKYHRLLRYVYLPDGTLYNAALIHDGYGFAYVVFPYTKMDEFRALETDARTHNRGLWAGCNIDDSTKIKQTTGNK